MLSVCFVFGLADQFCQKTNVCLRLVPTTLSQLQSGTDQRLLVRGKTSVGWA